RDLKPQNVMVGAFGEVQVMDWGLAKVLGQDPTPHPPPRGGEGESSARPLPAPGTWNSAQAGSPLSPSGGGARRGGLPPTPPGAVLGPPAYMAPEQARGESAALDERTDVFGLGAILCVILTGQPPYRGATWGEVHTRAEWGDLTEALARLEGSAADL